MASSRRLVSLALLLCAATSVGCERFPRDPRASLEQARARGALRVGVADAPPFVRDLGEESPLRGPEPVLIERFAGELGLEVEWRRGALEEHLRALEHFELDVVIGGLTHASPWRKHVGFTIPYFRQEFRVGFTQQPMRDELDGLTIAASPGGSLVAKLRQHGVQVVERQEVDLENLPIAAPAWELERLGRHPGAMVVHEGRHVLAVPPGENALLMALERFLLREVDREWIEKQLLRGRER